jgi:hypothetical protein
VRPYINRILKYEEHTLQNIKFRRVILDIAIWAVHGTNNFLNMFNIRLMFMSSIISECPVKV